MSLTNGESGLMEDKSTHLGLTLKIGNVGLGMFPLSLAANNRTSETVKHEPRSGKGKLLLATRSKHTQASALLQERKKRFLSVLVVGRRWKTPGRKMQLQMQPSRDHVCIFEIIDLHQVIDSQ